MNQENAQKVPTNPIISINSENNVGYRDTLDRAADILRLLTELDLSSGLSPGAENGLFWVQLMLIDSLNYVSGALEETNASDVAHD